MGQTGEELFNASQDTIESAVRFVAFRRRLTPADFQDLRSFVMLKLVENDYARLRKHQAEGSMAAYLSVVVHRLYLDYQIGRWGKWHPSAEAQRRGTRAVELERLIYRDGYELREAIELMATTGGGGGRVRDELWHLAYSLPVRHRARVVPEDQIRSVPPAETGDPIERRELDALTRKLQVELTRAVASLDDDDRLVLKMRYRDRRTVPQIAEALGVETKPLYARIRRLLGRVRSMLEHKGISGDVAPDIVGAPAREIDLDGVFASGAA